MKLIYFAWVRERIGVPEEEVDLPASVRTVGELVGWLAGRGDNYAHALENPRVIRAALDHRHVKPEALLAGATSVALFPPMTGVMTVRLQAGPFDVGAELAALTEGRTDVGAVVSFTGLCRDGGPDRRIRAMELDHYPALAQAELEGIEAEARGRWPLDAVLVIHRFGRLVPGEAIVLVAVASRHRAAAFEAAAFIMDILKTRAPFWKREEEDGGAAWVGAREDDEAAARWDERTSQRSSRTAAS